MRTDGIHDLLRDFRQGMIDEDTLIGELKKQSVLSLGHSVLDMDRESRNGFGEVIFCERKTLSQLRDIFSALLDKGQKVLGTRVDAEKGRALCQDFPVLRFDETARLIRTGGSGDAESLRDSGVLIVTGGTSDMSVAEEAARTLEFFGQRPRRLYDVGVAGLHRLLMHMEDLRSASVVIVIAGMEGALATVVGGLVSVPVIAVPTSVGYGSHFEGLASLLAMLNSCATGVTVVNIDNGFGAAAAALKMLMINAHESDMK